MTRFKAASTHLLISAILASAVIGLIIFGWYPQPYFWAIGGPLLIALIVGIDVVLGPLMTAILFNPKKSRRALTIDLTLIGIVQLSALIYGLHSGYVGRVVYGVFSDGSFHLVSASELAPKFIEQATLPEFRHVPFASQEMIGAVIPNNDKAREDIQFFKALGSGPQFLPQYYVPLEAIRTQLRSSAIPEDKLRTTHPALTQKIDRLLTERGVPWHDIAVLPFDVRTATYTALVDLQQTQVFDVLMDNPLATPQGNH